MRIALCQYNPIIGDFSGNREKIFHYINAAKAQKVDLIVFPELATTGYPPRDLLEQADFIADNLLLVDAIEQQADGIAVVVGFVRPRLEVEGRRLANSVALLRRGQPRFTVDKMLLPTYDVFDESRYFEAAKKTDIVTLGGIKIGLTICEDLWNVDGIPGVSRYERDPAIELKKQGAELLINISASPFWSDKAKLRRTIFLDAVKRSQLPVLVVNQVGANDDLIFDGDSFVLDVNGKIVAQAPQFVESMLLIEVEKRPSALLMLRSVEITSSKSSALNPTLNDDQQTLEALTLGIRDYFSKQGFKRAVIGLSGGVDSALVCALAARALGPENVVAIMMPSRFTSEMSLKDAAQLAKNLHIAYQTISIEPLFTKFLSELQPLFQATAPTKKSSWDITEENLQSRIRGMLLMAYSNKFGHLVLSTGNKSELAVGYCTLYGDLNGGLAVISDLLKTSVYRLCELLNRQAAIIPQSIMDRPPSAELRENQTDQDSLPPYDLLDKILRLYIEERQDAPTIIKKLGEAETVQRVLRLVDRNEFKRRQAPVGLKISVRAFGQGRRLPIVQKYQ
jgi:NAD+ synthetase